MNIEFRNTTLGTKLAFVRVGKCETPLLYIHGWLDNMQSFSNLAKIVDHPFFLIDLPGHGLSGHLKIPYSIERYCAEIISFMDINGITKATLVGHSLGAGICSALASAIPVRVSGLILLDAITPPILVESDTVLQIRRAIQFYRNSSRETVYSNFEEALKIRMLIASMNRISAQTLLAHELVECESGLVSRADPKLKLNNHQTFTINEAKTILSQITCPILVCLPEEGIMKHREDEMSLLEYLKARVQCYQGGHHFHMDSPDYLVKDILAFLGENHDRT